jgi:acyl-CoA synthetase (AMP-forming)/AMP-acid ligase II
LESSLGNFIDSHRPVWITQNNPITKTELEAFSQRHAPLINAAQDQNVALFLHDAFHTVFFLTMLQGRARQILLIPADLDEASLKNFVEQSNTTVVITDKEIISAASSGAPLKAPTGVDTVWIIPTSGTTGTPKLISHTLTSLTRTTKAYAPKAAEFIWGLLYSPARFAGLQVFLQCLIGGSTLILTDLSSPFENQVDELVAAKCNALSATPTMWRKILMTPAADRLPLKQITLGGEIVDAYVLNALRARFPNARITHIYASTEAGVGFAVNDGQAGFPASYLDTPVNGVHIKIDAEGFLMLKSQTESNSSRQQSLSGLFDTDGFINTGDLVIRSAERIYFLGRANGSINVGGMKVQPEEIEQVLLTFPRVNFAKVGAKRNAFTGQVIVATVRADVAPTEQAAFQTELLSYCRSKLSRFKVPSGKKFPE